GRGRGALCGRLIRGGRRRVIPAAAWQLGAHGLLPPMNDIVHFRRPRGVGRITAFCEGFAVALRTPVDRRKMRFLEPKTPVEPSGQRDVSDNESRSLADVHESTNGLAL